MLLIDYIKKKLWIIISVTILFFILGEGLDRLDIINTNKKSVSKINIDYNLEQNAILAQLESLYNNVADQRITEIHSDISNIFDEAYLLSLILDRTIFLNNTDFEETPKFLSVSEKKFNRYHRISFQFLNNDFSEEEILNNTNYLIKQHLQKVLEEYKNSFYQSLNSRYNILNRKLQLNSKINSEIFTQLLEQQILELDEKQKYLNDELKINNIEFNRLRDSYVAANISSENDFIYEILFPDLFISKYQRSQDMLLSIKESISNLKTKENYSFHEHIGNLILNDENDFNEFLNLQQKFKLDYEVLLGLNRLSNLKSNSLDFLENSINLRIDKDVSISKFSQINLGLLFLVISFVLTTTAIVVNYFLKFKETNKSLLNEN